MIDAPSSSEGEQAWRMFRVQQNGPNASGQTHYLSLSGFEIYGTVSGITDDPPGKHIYQEVSKSVRVLDTQNRARHTQRRGIMKTKNSPF